VIVILSIKQSFETVE